jgi:hypothetical protein
MAYWLCLLCLMRAHLLTIGMFCYSPGYNLISTMTRESKSYIPLALAW